MPLARVFEQMQRTDAFLGHCNLVRARSRAHALCKNSMASPMIALARGFTRCLP